MATRHIHDDGRKALSRSFSTSLRWPVARVLRLPKQLVRIVLGSAAAVALYALLGFQVVPRILRHQAIEFVREQYGRQLQIGEVFVQPFALALDVRDLALPDADGQVLIGWQRVYVNFEALDSLWQRGYVFSDIIIARPKVRVVERAGGKLNLADLAGPPRPVTPTAREVRSTQNPPSLAIRMLDVSDGSVEVALHDRSVPYKQVLSPVSFKVRNFQTTRSGGAFALSARSGPARFWWKGRVALSPSVGSSGRLAVAALPTSVVAGFLDRALPFAVPSGSLDLNGSYQVTVGEKLQASVKLGQLKLTKLAVQARGAPDTRIAIASMLVSNSALSFSDTQLDVERVRIQGLRTRVVREPDGAVNLARVFASKTAAAEPSSPSPWKVRLHALTVDDAELALEDQVITPPLKLRVVSLGLEVHDLTLDPSAAIPFSLLAKFDDDSTFKTSGSLTPESGAAELQVELHHARLQQAQPFLKDYADLTVHSGLLDVAGKVSLRPGAAGGTAFELQGGIVVSDLRTTDNLLHQPFVVVPRLELIKLRYLSAPETLQIEKVKLERSYARLVLSAQQTLNVSAILHGGKPGAGATAPAPREQPVSVEAAPELQVKVGSVVVNDLRLSFTDHFIQPNFSADLHGLSGSLKKLSSERDSMASLALRGTLGTNSPVRISGKLRPFAFEKFTDIELAWENLPLAVFNPYSGRFAGYSIERGDLSTAIHYQVRNGQLDAQHHIRVDQLTWGEATETKESAGLPVRLATALLRDRHGVISLDVPVQGSLKDPTFRVGPIVWQVIKNVCIKAVAAPFDLLGSLFQGAERARFVDFSPGDAALGSDDQKSLVSLGQALADRPSLVVDVPVGVDRKLDVAVLSERRYQAALQLAVAGEQRGSTKSVPFATLDVAERVEVLEALYKTLTGKTAEVPDDPAAETSGSFRDRRAARKAYRQAKLEQMSRAAIKIEDAELDDLGLRRADAVETALVKDGKVDTQRVLVSKEGSKFVRAEQGKIRFELALK